MSYMNLLPFLKWAGGKRWLADDLVSRIPPGYHRYIEPFLGGGALFLALAPQQAILSDTNKSLVECYRAIRDDSERINKLLEKHQARHCKEYYYQVRDCVNGDRFERAARFIYLNRTCWNGLYRVNLKGKFNVPIGTKNKVVLETDDFQATAALLKSADIYVSDFQAPIDRAVHGDVVFADPPYTVKHNLNGFVKYNENLFSWSDQERLALALSGARDRGVTVITTNADHESVRDLYSDFGFTMTVLTRDSKIAASPLRRHPISELLITA